MSKTPEIMDGRPSEDVNEAWFADKTILGVVSGVGSLPMGDDSAFPPGKNSGHTSDKHFNRRRNCAVEHPRSERAEA